MAIFYFIPKVHKGVVVPPPPTFHPIVAGIGSLNENLGAWLDGFLNPLVQLIPGFLKDTKQVIKASDGFEWNASFSWVTVDITSLYAVIPHDKALLALSSF